MDGARAFAQKMKPGFYVREVDGKFKTLWVFRGEVNGYSKKTHDDGASAMEWLVQRGCKLKAGLPAECYEEAERIREAHKRYIEAEQLNNADGATAPVNCASQDAPAGPGLNKDTHSQFRLLPEEEVEEDFSAYEPLVPSPVAEEGLGAKPAPSGAPEATSQTNETTRPEHSGIAPEPEKSCEDALSAPQTA